MYGIRDLVDVLASRALRAHSAYLDLFRTDLLHVSRPSIKRSWACQLQALVGLPPGRGRVWPDYRRPMFDSEPSSGSVNVHSKPPPTALRRIRAPPCLRAILRAIVSPSPVPPVARDRDVSIR